MPEQDVYLSYSDCEETSGPGAEIARDWFKANGITPFLVVDEGGAILKKLDKFMTKDVAAVGSLEKGYADVKFIARGKGGHSSQPPKHTPVARLAKFVNYCETHTVFKPKMSKAAKAMIYGMGDALIAPAQTVLQDDCSQRLVGVAHSTQTQRVLRQEYVCNHDGVHHVARLVRTQRDSARSLGERKSAHRSDGHLRKMLQKT